MALVNTFPQRLHANAARVIVQPFEVAPEPRSRNTAPAARIHRIVESVQALDNRTIQAELSLLLTDFETRHREMISFFEQRYETVASQHDLPAPQRPGERTLIGAYFCNEYSFAAAALMNPSVVPHPDQSNLEPGQLRFLMSLRAVGEGHISSITFREGVLSKSGNMWLKPESPFAEAAQKEKGSNGTVHLTCKYNGSLDETVLFPATPAQQNGLEDLRLLRFEDEKECFYCGTYTAYSGTAIASELLTTCDFRHFDLTPLTGPAARNKGMALFPRRVDGKYAVIGRQDNENLFLIYSNDLYDWGEGEKIAGPRYPWELVQMGNCGAPIELDEGWLVLTHGVGAMRKYCIGAMLLDKKDPSRLLGRSRVPLLSPSDAGREGYVPNVVYSCGALAHEGNLFLPFGIADSAVGFATIHIKELLKTLD